LDENDSVAALKIGITKGYKIPEELSIIGFDGILASRRLTPSLTTISQHGVEIGEVAAKLLIDRLESKENLPYAVVIKTKLKEESTRKGYSSRYNTKKPFAILNCKWFFYFRFS
jgi:LacI family transcriptional regulator